MSESNKTVRLLEKTSPPKPMKGLLYGFIFSILSAILNSISSIFVKKTVFFSGVDNAIIRFLVIMICSISIAKHKGVQIFSSKNPNKYLLLLGANAVTVIGFYIAMRLVSPSDAVSLLNTCILYLAIFSRIFLKEKFSIVHVVALALVGSGIIFITQPSYIFIDHQVKTNLSYNGTVHSKEQVLEIFSYSLSYSSIGYFLSLVTAFNVTFASLLVKKLTIHKVHFSVISFFTSIVTLPVGFGMVLVANVTGFEVKDYSLIHESTFIYEIIFVLIASSTSNC